MPLFAFERAMIIISSLVKLYRYLLKLVRIHQSTKGLDNYKQIQRFMSNS